MIQVQKVQRELSSKVGQEESREVELRMDTLHTQHSNFANETVERFDALHQILKGKADEAVVYQINQRLRGKVDREDVPIAENLLTDSKKFQTLCDGGEKIIGAQVIHGKGSWRGFEWYRNQRTHCGTQAVP